MVKKIKDLFLKVRIYVFLLGAVALNVLMMNIDSLLFNEVAVYLVIILVVLVDIVFLVYVLSRLIFSRRQKTQSQNKRVESEEPLLTDDSIEPIQEELSPRGDLYKQALKGFKTYSSELDDVKKQQSKSPDTLYEYVNELSMFMHSRGIEISKNNIREMLASLAASKVIRFTHKDIETAIKTVDALFEFVGFECVEFDNSTNSDGQKQSLHQEPDLYRFLHYADSHRNIMQVLSITNADAKSLEKEFNPFIQYALDPFLPVPITIDAKSKNTISKNTWVAFISSTTEDVVYSQGVAEGVFTITLDSELMNSETMEDVHSNKMTYEMFRDLLEDSYEEFYMDESFWKKIDELENYLKKYTAFDIDNRLFRQMERFTSAFLAFGGEKVDVIDAIMLNKLIHLFARLDFSELVRLKQDVIIEIDKLFGLENLYRSKPIIKNILEKHNVSS